MSTPDNAGGKAVLTLAHMAGMIDMVALPLWIGTLMQHYRYSPAQAGITVTVFLLGVVVASAFFAPRFNRIPRRVAAATGFALAAAALAGIATQPIAASSFNAIAALHAVAGIGTGCALTFTHGSIGRSVNPHRLWAVVNVALGVFAVMFLGGIPQLIAHAGAVAMFAVMAAVMGLAAVVCAAAFPQAVVTQGDGVDPVTTEVQGGGPRLSSAAWFIIAAVTCLTLNQAMVFSFMERIGAERGFEADRIQGVLIALGLVNLLPGVLAVLLQKRWSPVAVGMAGPVGQAVLAVTLSSAAVFALYAVAASLYVFMVIFTHTFLFGLLSRLDGTGRAAAGTPAMMMLGSCVGPALGGFIVQVFGYPGLGWAACIIACVAIVAMTQVKRRLPTSAAAVTAGE